MVTLFSLSGPSVSLAAAGVPVPQAPVTNTVATAANYPPLGMPEFSWTAVPDATMYRIQFSQDIGFTQLKLDTTTALTHFIPSNIGIFVDGDWYWRVRVEAPASGAYSSQTMRFTKRWADAAHKPVLLSPAEGNALDFYVAPVFSWQPIAGAASYQLQIDSNPNGFNPPLYIYRTLATTLQPDAKLANGTYYWRVLPLDPYDHYGTLSETRSFIASYGSGVHASEIPTLIEPLNGSIPVFTPTFRWHAVPGAQYYLFQHSTNDSFQNATSIISYNTTYTPPSPMENDVNYYWRVRSVSGVSISDWSSVFTFKKRWTLQPQLLTPTNRYLYTRFPLFSWTPVPAAAYYLVEVSYDEAFSPSHIFDSAFTSNPFYTPAYYYGGCDVTGSCTRFWRVTPYDSAGYKGKASDTSSFDSSYSFSAPELVFPFYYYTPRSDFNVSSREDRTVALPIFRWSRLTYPAPQGGSMAAAYRIEVSTDSLFMVPPDWSYDTESTSAVPTVANNFTPQTGVDYFWRVIRLTGIGGAQADDQWSQVWKVRFDPAKGIPATANTSAPTLLRPAHASEIVETNPLFEWVPVAGAEYYQVEVSSDPEFDAGYTVVSENVPYPAYTPPNSLAQRILGLTRLNYGTYYWRVRAYVSGSPAAGGWSEIHRFQIASQSEWTVSRTLGSGDNALQIASDPDDVADNNYELTQLYASQDNLNLYFRFKYDGTTAMTYGLYLDIDHKDLSGADRDARNYTNISVIPAHYPEYAIYFFKQGGGSFSPNFVAIYPWDKINGVWGAAATLASVGGTLMYNSVEKFVEIKVPNSAILMQDNTGSFAMSLFSIANATTNKPVDSVPSSPEAATTGLISRFASISDRINLVFPPNAVAGDPTVFPSVPPFFYDYPTGYLHSLTGPLTNPWAGARMEAHRDSDYTSLAMEYNLASTGAYYAPTSFAWAYDFQGDNTYYWRMKSRYLTPTEYFGVWTQGSYRDDPVDTRWHFVRWGFVPQHLTESVTFATPTFSWDRVEGAMWYELLVDNNTDFGTPEFSVQTAQTSYTPQMTLRNGTYNWKVRVLRWTGVQGKYSDTKTFTLALPIPANLVPNDPDENSPLHWIPTLCWDPLFVANQDIPVLSSWKYNVRVSKNPKIPVNEIYDQILTDQTCWTPAKGYDNGTYYWHVAMVDGVGFMGDYSPVATFVLQYPVTTLLAPLNGSSTGSTPTFEWTPVEGAALYHLEVSISPDFSSIFDPVDTNNARFVPNKLYPANTYYWRVAMIDRDGRWGPYTNATLIIGSGIKTFIPVVCRRR